MNQAFFLDTLPPRTSRLLHEFQATKPEFLSSFYLSGGTALSLQVGHRESEDLDFFCASAFDPKTIEQQLMPFGVLSQTELATGTLNTFLSGVKVQFLEYPYPLILPYISWEAVHISSISDIACTKMQTVGMRGSKKDFVDIYFLLKQFSLETLLSLTKQKYKASDYSETHILKSLVYFVDAETQPMPKMHQHVSWDEVKNTLITSVKAMMLE